LIEDKLHELLHSSSLAEIIMIYPFPERALSVLRLCSQILFCFCWKYCRCNQNTCCL